MVTITAAKTTATIPEFVCCPICKSALDTMHDHLTCLNPACATTFPIVDGVPVLINESRSVFTIGDFTSRRATTTQSLPPAVEFVMSHLPMISHNIVAKKNYKHLAWLLLHNNRRPRVLVVGGGALGEGMGSLLSYPNIELIETDVYFGSRTAFICDAHDLPFAENSFDGVLIQAVLEHVLDPFRCVEEVHRVLKPDGLVYAETPFMQQVHLGRYDFMRFTHLGHRKLFSRFMELESGALSGPGTVLSWSCEYFLLSFTRSRPIRMFIRGGARLTLFWLKYIDYYLIDKPGTFDNASGHYFLGRKADGVIADREIIAGYRGAIV